MASKSLHNWNKSKPPEMSGEQFSLWQSMIESRTGMQIPEQRKTFLQSNVRTRMSEIKCSSFQRYFEILQSGPVAEEEWGILTDRLTVQETHFFRHSESYDLVQNQVRQWLNADHYEKPIQVWSVGCSTGEEPYSLAMTLDEQTKAANPHNSHAFGITATDLSLPALTKAQQGIYQNQAITRQINLARQQRYFNQCDSTHMQIKPYLRDRICFARINVLDLKTVPFNELDIIFCQNLLIYFSRQRRHEIVSHLAERLTVGGIMLLGLGEITDYTHPKLEKVPSNNVLAYMRHNH